ncbi:hypothetical protein KIU71_15910 [Alteromonas sp. SM 2104]|nr:hypothetical protein [Alteromonas oceanisediminis]
MVKLSKIKVLLLALVLVCCPVAAHQQKAAITKVLFNPRTNNIEVMHRFILHDAEHAVKRLFDGDADIYRSAQTQRQFSDYVLDRFSLSDQNGNVLPLSEVGFEVDGKFMWVYQETPQQPDIQGLIVEHRALHDLWPAQTNTVNVEGKGPVQTLMFGANDSAQQVTFE